MQRRRGGRRTAVPSIDRASQLLRCLVVGAAIIVVHRSAAAVATTHPPAPSLSLSRPFNLSTPTRHTTQAPHRYHRDPGTHPLIHIASHSRTLSSTLSLIGHRNPRRHQPVVEHPRSLPSHTTTNNPCYNHFHYHCCVTTAAVPPRPLWPLGEPHLVSIPCRARARLREVLRHLAPPSSPLAPP